MIEVLGQNQPKKPKIQWEQGLRHSQVVSPLKKWEKNGIYKVS